MKTPREVLFERHRQAEPKLEVVRRQALAALAASGGAVSARAGWGEGLWLRDVLRTAWRELIWPSRRAWSGLAVLWLAMLTVNLEMKATSPAPPRARSVPVRDLAQAVDEQRRLLAELLPPVQPPPARSPGSGARPRTERILSFKAG